MAPDEADSITATALPPRRTLFPILLVLVMMPPLPCAARIGLSVKVRAVARRANARELPLED